MSTVTEGELDALSVSQDAGQQVARGVRPERRRWGREGHPQGRSSGWRAYGEVVFMFDMDEAGREAAIECAQLLSPGKAKIASLPLKDASDMLQAGRDAEVITALWQAKPYRPDGIINGDELWDLVSDETEVPSFRLPLEGRHQRSPRACAWASWSP